jgi:hypothetical protein
MNEKTPGQAAYEAMSQAAADFEDCTDLDIMSGWDALSGEHQAAIEAGARRLLSGGYPHVAQQLAERDHLEHELAAATRQARDLSALVEELEAKRDQDAARVTEVRKLAQRLANEAQDMDDDMPDPEFADVNGPYKAVAADRRQIVAELQRIAKEDS